MISSLVQAGSFKQTTSGLMNATGYIVTLCILLAILIALAVTVFFAFLPRSEKKTKTVAAARNTPSFSDRVNAIEKSYTSGSLSKQQAFHDLAAIAREYASARLGDDITTRTLAELNNAQILPHLQSSDSHGIDLLRSTIEALYPPEFANEASHVQGSQATVLEACRWVTALIDRWDA